MLKNESKWLSNNIYSLNSTDVFPILNIGSSTKKFREQTQPWIDANLFYYAREKNYPVIHMDIKKDVGVDIAGNLSDETFFKELQKLDIKSILCANLLEHVPNPKEMCNLISSLIPKGGYLFVTVPHEYPYHPDPLDTLFRPNVAELEAMFPNLKLLNGEVVYDATYNGGLSWPRPLFVLFFLIRIMLPFYQPKKWCHSLKKVPWLFKKTSVTCLVLQKN